MRNILAKLSGSASPSGPLDRFRGFGDNLEYVEASGDHPAYLIAHGEIVSGGQRDTIATAVNPAHPYTDFSTIMGQLPNTPLGCAVLERLNHMLDDKLVTFETEQPDRVDAVSVTSRPTDWLNQERFLSELEHHAKTKLAVKPILEASCAYGQQTAKLPYSSIKRAAEQIVDGNLELQRRLHGDQIPGKYVPLPWTEHESEF